MKSRVYISGPITGHADYMERFMRCEGILSDLGYEVINPAKVGKMLPGSFEHEEYMAVDLAMLGLCEIIFMMKGYEKSKGAKIELEYAINHHKTIFFEENGWVSLQR